MNIEAISFLQSYPWKSFLLGLIIIIISFIYLPRVANSLGLMVEKAGTTLKKGWIE
jgi:hypothetical protein